MPAPSAHASSLVFGNLEISHIRYGTYRWDGGAFFGVVPKALWSRKTQADESNRVEAAFNCYLIRTPEHTILVETACGDKPEARARARMDMPAEYVPLRSVIADAGFDPEAIDIVINSHLPWDHCGGNTELGRSPGEPVRAAFPGARYFA